MTDRATNIMPDCRFLRLSEFAAIDAAGADAAAFLQGQTSNDVVALATPGIQLNSVSTPQGRVVAVFWLLRQADYFRLILPRSQLDITCGVLGRYVLRSEVSLAVSDVVIAALSGPGCDQVLNSAGLGSAADTAAVSVSEDLFVAGLPGPTHSFLISGANSAVPAFSGAPGLENNEADIAWRQTMISSGIPMIYPATSDTFLAQMLNLDVVGGIDFRKGCFTGQEVIARAQHLGRVKRRMFRLSSTQQDAPVAGARIFSNSAAVGTVVDAVSVDGFGCEMLAVLNLSSLGETLALEMTGASELTFKGMPYSVPGSELLL